ncbi:DUF1707 domain-containing protein [Actinosynnema sp. NPDC050436]|uniref:DUF1707 domain-containing protein n=1 Tax=Actinosynnema sp. NPDC050436 TaxID=3155659 RepID=UPI0033D54E87
MSEPHQVRIGNQQREAAISALNDHFAAGRLEIGEYEQRVGYATAAETAAELMALFHDLPQPHPQLQPPPQTYYAPPTDYATPPPGYASKGYATPNHGYGPPPGFPPNAPYGLDPLTGQPLSDKSRIAAGVLQLVLPFGIGRFYIGDTGIGVAQLLTCGGCGIWSLIDGIILLVNGGTDSQGRKLRD